MVLRDWRVSAHGGGLLSTSLSDRLLHFLCVVHSDVLISIEPALYPILGFLWTAVSVSLAVFCGCVPCPFPSRGGGVVCAFESFLSSGDIVSISGVFLPVRYQGFRAMKAGLIADTYLQAQHIFRHKKSYDE